MMNELKKQIMKLKNITISSQGAKILHILVFINFSGFNILYLNTKKGKNVASGITLQRINKINGKTSIRPKNIIKINIDRIHAIIKCLKTPVIKII